MTGSAWEVLAGRYRLEELLGRGGMGEVWRGYDQTLARPVAVKLLAAALADAEMRERFTREARATAQIAHPNVVAVYDVDFDVDVDSEAGRSFLVMELLEGRSLAAELTARGQLPVAEVRDLVAQAAAGLHAAHRAGVVHRDVKPANLFRTTGGVLKVVDFGIARYAQEASARLTSAGTVVGTAAYLAPEQAMGGGGDARSDLYSLGCVLYELLCGRPPFAGGTAPEVFYQHVHATPEPVRWHRPDVPSEIDGLVLALLAKDPAARPADADLVSRALSGGERIPPAGGGDTAVLSGQPPGQPDVPTAATRIDSPVLDYPQRPRHSPRPEGLRGQRPVVVAGLAGVAVLAVLFLWVVSRPAGQSGTPGPPTAAAPAPTPAFTPSVTTAPITPAPITPAPITLTPPAEPPPRVGSEAWLRALDDAVTEQAEMGGIDPEKAESVHKRIEEILRRREQGRAQDVERRLRNLAQDLARAYEGRELDPGGPLEDFLSDSGADRLTRGGDD